MSDHELNDLILEALAGTLTPAQRAALEERLLADSAARRALLSHANLDAALRDWATEVGSASAWITAKPRIARRRLVFTSGWVGLAASLVLVAAWWSSRRPPPAALTSEQTERGYAVLTDAVGAEWSGSKEAMRMGDTLRAGPLVLQGGIAQIEFFSGAMLVLEGPAELEIVSAWDVVCLHGKVRVRVPPAANGFRLRTPGMTLVDLGTEFGAEVDRTTQRARVQVFDGEVEAHLANAAPKISLKRGQGLMTHGATVERLTAVQPENFINGDTLKTLSREQGRVRFAEWSEFSEQQRHDPRLLAYYPMSRMDGWERLVPNVALPSNSSRNGGAVGVVWSEGRWPQKSALEFKRPGDRVRLQIDGAYQAVTFTCWVRVDGLDRKYNALLLTDGYESGEPHWQIYEDGRLMFSVIYPDPADPRKKRNQIYFSPVLFDRSNTGRWHHVAVAYDNRTGAAVQYFDGLEVSREISTFH